MQDIKWLLPSGGRCSPYFRSVVKMNKLIFTSFASCTGDYFAFSKSPQFETGKITKIIAQSFDEDIILVDPPRENWNCIFAEIAHLSKKLEQLGIDAIREADDV